MTQGMHFYKGRHAELYDLFYASKPYVQEAEFVHRCIIKHGGERRRGKTLLELACGTGSHAIHFAKLGYQITAVDNSPEMLRQAEEKAAKENVHIAFKELDMRDLSQAPGVYDVVVCLFDSLGYVQTDASLSNVFSGVNARLRDGGLFIFEFWHAPPMLSSHDPVRVRRFPINGGTILRISETTLRPQLSLAEVTYSIYELWDDGTYSEIMETHSNRFFTLAEVENYALTYGFSHSAFYAGFQDETRISDQTWHVLAVWKK